MVGWPLKRNAVNNRVSSCEILMQESQSLVQLTTQIIEKEKLTKSRRQSGVKGDVVAMKLVSGNYFELANPHVNRSYYLPG